MHISHKGQGNINRIEHLIAIHQQFDLADLRNLIIASIQSIRTEWFQRTARRHIDLPGCSGVIKQNTS
uniref:AlNc14C90G5669 protein n=1 Tax=Albugo laibachii Nc14 TaxID=890382 RepID=F0WGD7_9STRA|nr:AlNc14C90G5669 [Albugo laibachii Nc14]|eukprot:CCA20298.1 AlNc14C90G5669 [Albugo laibachii Nc14]